MFKMDHDIKDLIILGSAVILSAFGAYEFKSVEVLMAGITGAFAFLGVKAGAANQNVVVTQSADDITTTDSDDGMA